MHLVCVVLCTVLEFMHDVINSLHNNDDTKLHDFCAKDKGNLNPHKFVSVNSSMLFKC